MYGYVPSRPFLLSETRACISARACALFDHVGCKRSFFCLREKTGFLLSSASSVMSPSKVCPQSKAVVPIRLGVCTSCVFRANTTELPLTLEQYCAEGSALQCSS